MNTLDHLFGPQSQAEQVETNTFVLMSRFLQLIEQVMEEKKITRRVLAERIGTSGSYVTQLFRGHKMANLETLAKIEMALGIRFDVKLAQMEQIGSISNEDMEIMTKVESSDLHASYFSEHYSPKLSLAYGNVG